MKPILYTREEVITIVRAHLIKTTMGNLTDREIQIIGEVESALPYPRQSVNSILGSRVGKTYRKEVAA